jgi:hypothetical protein
VLTATPAQHGPDGSEHLTGPVVGFVLTGRDLPTVYLSGDNASLDVVRAVSERFSTIDVAIMFAGGAKTALLGDEYLTFSSAMTAEAVSLLSLRCRAPLWFTSTGGPTSASRAAPYNQPSQRPASSTRSSPLRQGKSAPTGVAQGRTRPLWPFH